MRTPCGHPGSCRYLHHRSSIDLSRHCTQACTPRSHTCIAVCTTVPTFRALVWIVPRQGTMHAALSGLGGAPHGTAVGCCRQRGEPAHKQQPPPSLGQAAFLGCVRHFASEEHCSPPSLPSCRTRFKIVATRQHLGGVFPYMHRVKPRSTSRIRSVCCPLRGASNAMVRWCIAVLWLLAAVLQRTAAIPTLPSGQRVQGHLLIGPAR